MSVGGEIRLSSDLANALNRYFDVWAKFYPIARNTPGEVFYFAFKVLGYLPSYFYEKSSVAEYRIGTCGAVVWNLGPSAIDDIRRHPEVEVMDYFGGRMEPKAVLLDMDSSPLSFIITEKYYVTSREYRVIPREYILRVNTIALTRGELDVRGRIDYNGSTKYVKLEYSVEGGALRYRRGIDVDTKSEIPAWMNEVGMFATKSFLTNKKDDLVRALNCAVDTSHKLLLPTVVHLLF